MLNGNRELTDDSGIAGICGCAEACSTSQNATPTLIAIRAAFLPFLVRIVPHGESGIGWYDEQTKPKTLSMQPAVALLWSYGPISDPCVATTPD